jgi:hypothetical protein
MVVFVTYDLAEAHIVAGRLQTEGVPALVYREPGASAIGIHIGKFGEVRVLVRPEDYETALLILEPQQPPELPDTTDEITYWLLEDDDDTEQHAD